MTGLYQVLGVPFGYILYFLYHTIAFENYGIAIIMLTFIARLFMLPTTIHQQKGMAKTQRIQAKVRKIQEKYAGDQKRIQEETQALYSREGYNPMNAGCAPMAVQFLLLFGLIGAIYYPLSNFLHIDDAQIAILTEGLKSLDIGALTKSPHLNELFVIENIKELAFLKEQGLSESVYNTILEIKNGGHFEFLGISLGDIPMNYTDGFHKIWLIPVFSTVTTLATSFYSFFRQKQTNSNPAAGKSMGCMTIGMAAMSLYFVVRFPAGIGLYWIASGLFGFISTVVIGKIYSPNKVLSKLMVEETVERRSRENSLKLVTAEREKEDNM